MNQVVQGDGTSERGPGLTSRLGFWLGLAVFAALLWLPPPRSMHQAVRAHFGEAAIAADVAELGGAALDGEVDDNALERRVVQARAETMMAAAAVTALVALWWITVALPIPVTSLLPLTLLPVVGVMTVPQAARPYANHNIFLFMGGFILALAVQRWGLHRRLALQIVRRLGGSEATIVLGFMVASAALSMWISNTATTMMLLPIGLAVVQAAKSMQQDRPAGARDRFAPALMLGIAYAASIGGLATPIGTPPNIVFRGQLAQLFPDAPGVPFARWVLVCGPLTLLFLPLAWVVLTRVTCPLRGARLGGGREVIDRELRALGPMGTAERRVAIVFAATAVLWMTRRLPVGDVEYGWAALLQRVLGQAGPAGHGFRADYINDASVALVMAVLLFIIPARSRRGGAEGQPEDGDRATNGGHAGGGAGSRTAAGRERLMDWATATRLPWGILLLFGGGFAIAEGFRSTGLSQWCGQVFAGLDIASPLVLVLATCLLMTFLTEITSNTATSQVMLPILARVAVALHIHPFVLMMPATLSASCAFMLPVATPPNAIVFASGHVRMKDMVISGVVLNLAGALFITVVFYTIMVPLLGIAPDTPPDWVRIPGMRIPGT